MRMRRMTRTGADAVREYLSEEEFRREFLDPVRRHFHAVVQGTAGSGVSEERQPATQRSSSKDVLGGARTSRHRLAGIIDQSTRPRSRVVRGSGLPDDRGWLGVPGAKTATETPHGRSYRPRRISG